MVESPIPVLTLKSAVAGHLPVHFKLEILKPKAKEEPSELHRHDYCEFLMFREGGGHHMIDFENHEILSNSLHWVAPGQVHQLFRQKHVTGYVLIFSKEFLFVGPEAVSECLLPVNMSPCELTVEKFAEFEQLILQMNKESEAGFPMHKHIIRAFLNIFLYMVRRLEQKESTGADEAVMLVTRFQEVVEKQFREWHLVKQYAHALSISEKVLNLAVKSKTGKTCSAVIQERLLLEAKRLLVHSGLTTKEIAYNLQFEDPSHFSKFFRRHCHLSPSEFQKQYS